MKTPGVMIAAVKSGSGKTTITCAFLKQLLCRKKHPVSFKCGPDYIDPMFHRTILGVPGGNLDTYFTGEAKTKEIFLVLLLPGFEEVIAIADMDILHSYSAAR